MDFQNQDLLLMMMKSIYILSLLKQDMIKKIQEQNLNFLLRSKRND